MGNMFLYYLMGITWVFFSDELGFMTVMSRDLGDFPSVLGD